MKIYRYNYKPVFISFLSLLFAVGCFIISIMLSWEPILKGIFIFSILMAFYNIIDCFSTGWIIDDKALRLNTLLKSKIIPWDEVIAIQKIPVHKGIKVIIKSKTSKIYVSYWIKNYQELLKEILIRCKNNKDIFIDEF